MAYTEDSDTAAAPFCCISTALGRPRAMDALGPTSEDIDGPGVDLATLNRVVAMLEEP